jgi:hypothetical protein
MKLNPLRCPNKGGYGYGGVWAGRTFKGVSQILKITAHLVNLTCHLEMGSTPRPTRLLGQGGKAMRSKNNQWSVGTPVEGFFMLKSTY